MRLHAVVLAGVLLWPLGAHALTVNLGTAVAFGVLGASTVTNTGDTVITGDLGVSTGTAITGFPPGIYSGSEYTGTEGVVVTAKADAAAAYSYAALLPFNDDLSGQDLGGLTLTPGVYFFSSSAQLTGTLTLNAEGNPNAVFIFQIGTTLTTASNADVNLINGASGANVFWQVGSSATLGTTTDLVGTIDALASVTLNTGANIACGRAIALTGAVTMDDNTVGIGGCFSPPGGSPVPESSTWAMMLLGFAGLGFVGYRKSRKAVSMAA